MSAGYFRRLVILLIAFALPMVMVVAIGGPGAAASIAAHSAANGSHAAAATQGRRSGGAVGTSAQAKPASGKASGHSIDGVHIADITLRLSENGHRLTATIRPTTTTRHASLRFMITANGHVTRTPSVRLGTLRPGKTRQESAAIAPPGTGRTGLQAVLDAAGGLHQTAFLAAEAKDGGYATATNFDGLADAALNRDLATHRITKKQYRTRYHRQHGVPGFTRSKLRIRKRVQPSSAATPGADTTATVKGTVTYHDRDGTARPVRHAWVAVEEVQTAGIVAHGRTADDGSFSLTFQPDGCYTTAYEILVRSDDGYGVVADNIDGVLPYEVMSTSTFKPCAQETLLGTDVDIPKTNTRGKAFALLDALDTVGSYYAGIRESGWPASLTVRYPGTNEVTSASGDHPITVPGNSVQCDTGACPEEAFDWDALAHESGHVVAMSAGFSAGVDTSGGHYVCANAWKQEETSKSDAIGLAWEEGWPTFYGLSVLQASNIPSGIPDVKDGDYIDHGGVLGHDFSYSLDDDGAAYGSLHCKPTGDDSEMAVQRALWEFHDSSADAYSGGLGWPLSRFLSRFESSKPKTFTAAYNALIQGDGSAAIEKTRKTLTVLGFAPKVVRASAGPNAAGASVSWNKGGDSGVISESKPNGTPHPNNKFTVQFVDSDSGSVIVQDTTSHTGYTATSAEQNEIATHAHVAVDVLGEQTDSPTSGPFGSASKALVHWSATPDSGLDSMWNSYGNNATCADWSGGDATNSVTLPDGERAWFFSDSYLGSPAARKTIWYSSAIHNSIVMQSGGNLTKTITGGNTCQEKNLKLDFWDRYAKTPANAPDAGGFYWTGDQHLVGSNVVKFYYHGYPTTTADGGHSFAIDYPAVASIPASSLESKKALTITPQKFTCGPSGIIWGTAIVKWNDALYVYGWRSTGTASSNLYLAKTTAANLANPSTWQVFDGTDGSTASWLGCSAGEAEPLPINDTTTGFSVSSINGALWLVQFDYTNGQLNAEGAIGAHPASKPWGFTDTSVPLYYPPTGYVAYPYYYQDYEARIQPGLGGSGHVVLSYNVNTVSVDTGCVSANVHDASIYRPRFVDIPTTAFNTAAAVAAPATRVPAAAGGQVTTVAGHTIHVGGFRGRWPLFGPEAASAARTGRIRRGGADRSRSVSPAASGGIDGSTDWFKRQLGGGCPTIPKPGTPVDSIDPDGTVNLGWLSSGTDVWYYVYFCDETTDSCTAQGTTAPWTEAWSTPDGNLWSPEPDAPITPATTASTDGYNASGDTFVIYVQAFGAGNSNEKKNSSDISIVDTIQPPAQVTGLSVTTSPGPTGTIYNLSWDQVTYPSTAVYYSVRYCDTTAMTCGSLDPTQWPSNGMQLGRTAAMSAPAGDKMKFCVQASNLGGQGPCSSVVS